jgi:hypothetical protein
MAKERTLDVITLRVSNGDSRVVKFPTGKFMLIDINQKDSGEDIDILSYLESVLSKKDDKPFLDYLVITHPDNDHINGAKILFKKVVVGSYWDNGFQDEKGNGNEDFRFLVKKREEMKKSGNYRMLKAKAEAESFEEITMTILAPFGARKNDEDEEHNEGVAVMQFEYKGNAMIFASDSDVILWKEKIMPYFIDKKKLSLLGAKVLHASHHGSFRFFTDKRDNFESEEGKKNIYYKGLNAIDPQYVGISAKDRGRGPKDKDDSPPHLEAVEIYQKQVDKRDGEMNFTCDGSFSYTFTEAGKLILKGEVEVDGCSFEAIEEKRKAGITAPAIITTGRDFA